jgi:hypothetical protein
MSSPNKTRKTSKSTSSSIKKVVKKPKIYLSEIDIKMVLDEANDIIQHKKVPISHIKEVLSEVSYNPKFKSYFYEDKRINQIKQDLKKLKVKPADIKRVLHREQLNALMREWCKGYIDLDEFTERSML